MLCRQDAIICLIDIQAHSCAHMIIHVAAIAAGARTLRAICHHSHLSWGLICFLCGNLGLLFPRAFLNLVYFASILVGVWCLEHFLFDLDNLLMAVFLRAHYPK